MSGINLSVGQNGLQIGRWSFGSGNTRISGNGNPLSLLSAPHVSPRDAAHRQAQQVSQDLTNVFGLLETAMNPYDKNNPSQLTTHTAAVQDFVNTIQYNGGPDRTIQLPQNAKLDLRLEGSPPVTIQVRDGMRLRDVMEGALKGRPELAREVATGLGITLNAAGQAASTGTTLPAVDASAALNADPRQSLITEMTSKLQEMQATVGRPDTLKGMGERYRALVEEKFSQIAGGKDKALVFKDEKFEITVRKNDGTYIKEQIQLNGGYNVKDLIDTIARASGASKEVLGAISVAPAAAAAPAAAPAAPKTDAPAAKPEAKLPEADWHSLNKDQLKQLQAAMENEGFSTNQKAGRITKGQPAEATRMDGLFEKGSQHSLKAMAEKTGMTEQQLVGVMLHGDADQKKTLHTKLHPEKSATVAPAVVQAAAPKQPPAASPPPPSPQAPSAIATGEAVKDLVQSAVGTIMSAGRDPATTHQSAQLLDTLTRKMATTGVEFPNGPMNIITQKGEVTLTFNGEKTKDPQAVLAIIGKAGIGAQRTMRLEGATTGISASALQNTLHTPIPAGAGVPITAQTHPQGTDHGFTARPVLSELFREAGFAPVAATPTTPLERQLAAALAIPTREQLAGFDQHDLPAPQGLPPVPKNKGEGLAI